MGGLMQQVGQLWKSSGLDTLPESWPEIPPMIQKWAISRGYDNLESFQSFYQFKLKDLTDPMSLKDMDKAVDRLLQAYEKQEKVCVYADFDMDGTPGLALLLRGLRLCGFQKLTYFQPNRFEHGYGVHADIVQAFIEDKDVKLFVTVDVGITDVEAVQRAKDLHVDFIVTDHHQVKEVRPPAVAIVNPNQPECESGLEYLCGAGVAFYLVLALRRKMKERNLLQQDFNPKALLDCFAIATLTDMVPVVKDNRVLVQHGLVELQKTSRKGLQHLMKELRLSEEQLMAQDVSIRLSPKLNALGRMNSEVSAIDLFLVDDEDKAFELVKEVLSSHEKRVSIQKEGEGIIEDFLKGQPGVFNHLFLFSEHFYKGVVGILATKILNRYGVPALVGTVKDNKIVGSARAPDGMNVLAALEASSGYLNSFGGHKQAAGFELNFDQATPFAQSLHSHFAQQGGAEDIGKISYDFEGNLTELNNDFLQWMKRLEPLGRGFDPPLMHFSNLFVASVRVLKEVHLKLVLKDISGKSIDALWFFADDIAAMKKLTSKRVRVLAEPSRNTYKGNEKLQLMVRNLKVEAF